MKRILTTITTAALALSCAACSTDTNSSEAKNDQFTIFATTGYLADAAKNIAPDAKVITLVGPGADPHTYQPSTKDIETMRAADAVFWNGLHLEAQMLGPLKSLGDKQLAVGEALDQSLLLPFEDNEFDPHIWNDPQIWQQVVGLMADKLGKLDAKNAAAYKNNASKYQGEIAKADKTAKDLLDKVAEPRILVTGHDAFNYFGRTYDLKVYATDFVSTAAARSAAEINEIAEIIANKQVPAIFNDSQANPQAISSLKEAVESKGWNVKMVAHELYADTLGADADTDTYIEVLLHNARTVAQELAAN